MHALRLEVLDKQEYIFSTNKLREAVGASQLVAVSTTVWLEDALDLVARAEPEVTVGKVVVVSGLAMVTVSAPTAEQERRVCRALVREVTTRSLRPARPDEQHDGGCGLHVLGVWMPVEGTFRPDHGEALRNRVAEHRATSPRPQARLQRLPVVAACGTSDGPAAHLLDERSGGRGGRCVRGQYGKACGELERA